MGRRLAPGNSVKVFLGLGALGLLVALGAFGCRALEPPTTPEEACIRRCKHALKTCSEVECERGCGLILDKLVEGEGEKVFTCLSRHAQKRCDDRVWAFCGVRTGIYVDGGPPPPPPPREWDDEPEPKKEPAKKNDEDLL